jgi:hypothetical protein
MTKTFTTLLVLTLTTIAAAIATPLAAGDALPDGRVYEQVSPTVKNGADAGVQRALTLEPKYSVATADGSAVLYGTSGPMGTVHRGLQAYTVSRRGADGWTSESALPGGSHERIFAVSYGVADLLPSSDLSTIVFLSPGSWVPENPVSNTSSAALYAGHANGTIDWLSRPQIANSFPAPGEIPFLFYIQAVGASPDLSTIYFWAEPTLLPEDATRASGSGWGLYEYSGGVLKPAGTLPDGTQSPGGAAPASTETGIQPNQDFTNPDTFDNQVSRDGSTLWFVSPDPNAHSGPVPQLYVRRGGHSTLVSHDAGGAPAPSGASPVLTRSIAEAAESAPQMYSYGSADGSAAIFQSVDALAPGAPNDGTQKAYRYDVATDTVSYLPGVGGTSVVAASDDGQRFLFTGGPQHVALWDHGTITEVATAGAIGPARATASGSDFVFSSENPIPGFNSTQNIIEIYRYDVAEAELLCVSCPPKGQPPTGSASLSNQDFKNLLPEGELLANRGVSIDGRRVFFDTPDALSPRDTNGQRDVYEWTPEGVSLISSGRSQDPSFFLDSSATGDDVFFATTEGLSPEDTDGAYDVYDARVGGGFKKAEQAAPCAGEACRAAASSPPSLLAPASVGLPGLGNLEPSPAKPSAKLKLGGRRLLNGALEVSLVITRPGQVTLSGGDLRSATKTYSEAGTFKVKAALTAAAKRSLRAKHRLRLSVRVGYTPESGAVSRATFVLNVKA